MVIATVWHAERHREALPTLKLIKPHVIMLHSTPEHLERVGKRVATELRQVPELQRNGAPPEIWFGVAGDVGHSATAHALSRLAAGDAEGQAKIVRELQARRLRAVQGALAAGVRVVMWDPESAHKSGIPGFNAAAATGLIALARHLAPDVRQLVTSFDCPTLHHAFPWRGWDDADGWAPQIYAAPAGERDEQPEPGKQPSRWLLHERHWHKALAEGLLRDRPYMAYVQAHHVSVQTTCKIANKCGDVAMWAFPSRVDANGILAARALVALEDAGFTGAGRFERFQAAHGLTPDGAVGPKTLAALGIS